MPAHIFTILSWRVLGGKLVLYWSPYWLHASRTRPSSIASRSRALSHQAINMSQMGVKFYIWSIFVRPIQLACFEICLNRVNLTNPDRTQGYWLPVIGHKLVQTFVSVSFVWNWWACLIAQDPNQYLQSQGQGQISKCPLPNFVIEWPVFYIVFPYMSLPGPRN